VYYPYNLFKYITTGETESAPNDWIGGVIETNIFSESVLIAAANPLSDINTIVKEFREKYV